jgi:hypothetical protein
MLSALYLQSFILTTNAIMLVITAYLSVNLMLVRLFSTKPYRSSDQFSCQGFMRATYDRVGATALIARAYKVGCLAVAPVFCSHRIPVDSCLLRVAQLGRPHLGHVRLVDH